MATSRAAGFIIYRRLKSVEYLLLQASYGSFHWTPPKGHVDPGEDDMTTAFRETFEESGLHKDLINVHSDMEFHLNYKAYGKSKTVVYWLAELTAKNAEIKLSDEHQAFKWVEYPEALNLSGFDDLKRLFTKCNEYLNSL
ncbi:bis(5'-nucleosyl)-tetraphosphatase [asymmetrical] [Hydra vulgaris]|uniref:Bis(5'-nucleosyl)-tetraphosphatase [asymmetrical] n=1 Tax=Hydra vulgaris TaxID=6087 RepID=T2MEX2_HYDVU|nr:bis(5'-nucleosyl)-tetraphosphatase [asymmetrical] [Hydra vulgaris]